tara:strand:- start:361 stop:486 length:126 start_codon:yes stop_codon:yes gene_type:complete
MINPNEITQEQAEEMGISDPLLELLRDFQNRILALENSSEN